MMPDWFSCFLVVCNMSVAVSVCAGVNKARGCMQPCFLLLVETCIVSQSKSPIKCIPCQVLILCKQGFHSFLVCLV